MKREKSRQVFIQQAPEQFRKKQSLQKNQKKKILHQTTIRNYKKQKPA